MDFILKDVEDENSNGNFKNLMNNLQNTHLGTLTTTQISNLNTDELRKGVLVYDETADALKVLVVSGGVKTFKTVTVS